MNELSSTLAAVADPTRRAILARLIQGPATVGELAEPFDISQQAVSKHLAQLLDARLVEKERRGRTQVCTLRPDPIREVAAWAEDYRRLWEARFGMLDDVLQDLQAPTAEKGSHG